MTPAELARFAARRTRVARWILAVYWPVLAIATHVPAEHVPRLPDNADKFLHLLAYAVLASLLWRALPPRLGDWARTGAVLGLCAAYATLDEALQGLPAIGRSADLRDWIFDLVGVVAALVGCLAFRSQRRDQRLLGPEPLEDLVR